MLVLKIWLRKIRTKHFKQIKRNSNRGLSKVSYSNSILKKEVFANRIEQFPMSVCKQILGVRNVLVILNFCQDSAEHH